VVREALTRDRLLEMEPDEAAALFIARRAEGLTESEGGLLAEWLAADRAHEAAFGRAGRAWGAFEDCGDDEIIAAMRERAVAPSPRRWPSWRRAAAAAAALILLASTFLLVPGLFEPPGGRQAPASAVRYATARGQVSAIALPDGSRMTLDSDSEAAGRFGAGEREVALARGRAYFDVRPGRSTKFEVTAAGRRVVALGTGFEVDLAGNAIKVTLVHGAVTVGPLDRTVPPVTLRPGQQFVERGGVRTIVTVERAADVAGWRGGLIAFDDEPLGEAVAEINRYSRDQLVIRDPAVAAMRISGQFRAGEAERFARTLAEVHPVRVVRRGSELEIVPTG